MNNLNPVHNELAETLRLDVLDHSELFECDDDVYSVSWQFKDSMENVMHEHYAHISTLMVEGGTEERRRSIMNRECAMASLSYDGPEFDAVAHGWNFERTDGGFDTSTPMKPASEF